MKRLKYHLGLMTVLFLTGCRIQSPPNQILLPLTETTVPPKVHSTSQVITSATSYPQAISSPTQTNTNKQTSLPTFVPSPTSYLGIETLALDEEGVLWIYLERQYKYLAIDLEHDIVITVESPPNDCRLYPIPNTHNVICEIGDQVYLYDLLTGNKQTLPIVNPSQIWYSRNLLYYRKPLGTDLHESVYAYNISSNETKLLTTIDLHDEYLFLPTFSYDGKYLVAARNNQIFEINQETGDFYPISPNDPAVTNNIAWSPTASQLVYGATRGEQEIGLNANYVFLLDMEDSEIRQLSSSFSEWFAETGWPVWSPSGKEVIANSVSTLCIFAIEEEKEFCRDIDVEDNLDNYHLDSITWSPNEKYIAFLEHPTDSTLSDNLVVYSRSEDEFITLIEGIDIKTIFWQK